MQKPRKTMGKKNSFSFPPTTSKSTPKKPQVLLIIRKINLTNSIDWSNIFFNLKFGTNPTKWLNNIFIDQKSIAGLSKTTSDKNELNFSPKNYFDFKSPSNLVETEPNLVNMKTIFSLFSKFNLDGSETLCDKRSSKNHQSNRIPADFTGLEREMTTKGKTPSSDDDLSPMKIEVGRPIPTSTLPTALSISAPVFSPLVSTENLTLPTLNYTKRLGPPPLIPYDPDAIFGGDFDEDPYDYSDDEGDLCFGFDRSVPCSPRPPSQDQPTTEGLRAWNEERGLFWGRTLFTQLSETDITPSYPYFTPWGGGNNLVSL